jgi:chemotaxis protein CheD
MLALEGEVADVYLNPGESHLARTPTVIRTLLGSCVGISFWSARLRIGALCHAQLPKAPAGGMGTLPPSVGHRYVDFAIRDFVRRFEELGADRSQMEVKMFGGADVLLVSDPATATIGRMNCEMARRVVEEEGLRVLASSLGGVCGLNIKFDTRTGEVWVRRLHRVLSEEVETE